MALGLWFVMPIGRWSGDTKQTGECRGPQGWRWALDQGRTMEQTKWTKWGLGRGDREGHRVSSVHLGEANLAKEIGDGQ